MASQIRNNEALRKALQPAIQKACNYVIQKIWNENRELVRTIVYEAGMPKEYARTMGFLDSWEYTSEEHNPTSKDGYAKFYYKPNEMNIGSPNPGDPDYGQHVGVMGDYYGRSSRDYLADIIYHENGCRGAGPAFGEGYWRSARNAWKELNKRLGARLIKKWMKEGFERAGLTVQSHNAPITITKG